MHVQNDVRYQAILPYVILSRSNYHYCAQSICKHSKFNFVEKWICASITQYTLTVIIEDEPHFKLYSMRYHITKPDHTNMSHRQDRWAVFYSLGFEKSSEFKLIVDLLTSHHTGIRYACRLLMLMCKLR
jgi:hypothetical protein